MSFSIPFIAIDKLLNVEDYITGKISVKNVSNQGDYQDDDDDDDTPPPILSPQPVPGLLSDHSKVESSRGYIENVWNTQKEFPLPEKHLNCLYCGVEIYLRPHRWFLPTRRERRVNDDTNEIFFIYSGEGIFCTYYCTYMHCDNKKMKAEKTEAYMKMLKLMYKDLDGNDAPEIHIKATRDNLYAYGGKLSKEEFSEISLKYEPK